MKAMVYDKYGPPEVLHLEDLPLPEPGPGQVRIKVAAVALNAADWHLLRADPWMARLVAGLFRPKKHVLGADVAGVVDALGVGVTAFRVGDAVFGGLFESGLGGLAEYAIANADCLATKPASLSFVEASGLPMASLTALQGLRDHGKLTKGQRVLIHGASGGVGSFAVQWGKILGAEVTAVCSTRKVETARAAGADAVIDYLKTDFATQGKTYDLVVGINGDRTLDDYLSVLTPTGTYLMIGGTNRQIFQALLQGAWKSRKGGKRVTTFTAKTSASDLQQTQKAVDEGSLKVTIERTYPLEKTIEAFHFLEDGHAAGKIVIDLAR